MRVTARPSSPAASPPDPVAHAQFVGGVAGAAIGTAVSLGLGALLHAAGQEPVATVVATAATAWFVTPLSTMVGALLAGVSAAERGP